MSRALLDHAQHCSSWRRGQGNTIAFALHEVLSGSHSFEGQEEIVLICGESESVLERDDTSFNQVSDYSVKMLHSIEFSISHSVKKGLAVGFAGLNILACART